ncbi:MAG TPA: DUF4331 family protein [Gemmatimonadaceae bacterium]|jgi:hypothetical protein|nr:DUF4331 family protein [Gemmatimonadaceae bacterium]
MNILNFISVSPKRALAGLVSIGLVLGIGAACNDNTELTGVDTNRVYNQIERLGNPLVSEVFFPKRDHGLHNNKSPIDDTKTVAAGGTDVPGHIAAFVGSFPNRTQKTITTLQAVLAPDELLVFPNRAPATAGWLSWALANGYGGRKLTDDVVDVGLSAVFGNALDAAQPVLAGLTSDNVPPSVRSFSATFPYLEVAR